MGVIALSAPVGVIPLEGERLLEIFPDRHAGEDGILNIVSGPTPPLFLGHGEDDTTVFPINSTLLGEKVIAGGQSTGYDLFRTKPHRPSKGALAFLRKYEPAKI